MPITKKSEAIVAALREASTSIEALRDIAQIATYSYACDATSALRNGCVLLAVTPAPKTANGDGFIYLLGLPHGVHVNPHLSLKFRE